MKRISKDQLWDYLDGSLPDSAKAGVEQWLAADAGNRRQLDELRSLGQALRTMETDAPPMRFTASVMEVWDRELALRATPLHTRTDKRIVYGIAALLAGILLFTFGLLISAVDGSPGLTGQVPVPDGAWLDGISETLGGIFAGGARYFVGITIILLMVLLERCVHYRHHIRGMQ